VDNDSLTEAIIAAAIEVHRILGPGLLESIYEDALVVELRLRGIQVERQVAVDVDYKGQILKGMRVDLLIDNEVVVELKAVARSPETATAQVLSYLRFTRLKRGLLLNFGLPRLIDGVKRISL
jgi:GxxExxY protein